MVNLLDILKHGIKGALKEDWAWAVCHQCVKYLIRSNTSTKNIALFGIQSIDIQVGGSIIIVNEVSVENELKVVESIGIAVYNAFDYGISSDLEQELTEEFENLIFLMTKNFRQSSLSNYLDDDEGYDGTICSLSDVLDICEKQVSSVTNDADKYYRSKCQSLLNTMQPAQQDIIEVEYMDEEFKNVWEMALDELRKGIPQLKHVEINQERNFKCETTKFQLLLEDIIKKKYHLKQPVSPPPMKNAHDQVLEFVKSRPSLSPAHQRVLLPPPSRSKSVHQLLVDEIKNKQFELRHVKIQEKSQINENQEENLDMEALYNKELADHDDLILSKKMDLLKDSLEVSNSKKKHFRRLSLAGKMLVKRSLTFQEIRKPSLECLSLTIEEITHVRKVLSRAQLEMFRPSKQLYLALKTEKICFICRVKRFSIFSWSYTCQICERRVCWECVRKVPIRPNSTLQSPVFTFKSSLFPSQNKLGLLSNSLSSSTLSLNQTTATTSANTPVRTLSRIWLNKPAKKADICTECHIVLSGANIT